MKDKSWVSCAPIWEVGCREWVWCHQQRPSLHPWKRFSQLYFSSLASGRPWSCLLGRPQELQGFSPISPCWYPASRNTPLEPGDMSCRSALPLPPASGEKSVGSRGHVCSLESYSGLLITPAFKSARWQGFVKHLSRFSLPLRIADSLSTSCCFDSDESNLGCFLP